MYKVTLKPGHPTGIYRRAGFEFIRQGVELEKLEPKVLKVLQADPWLDVTEVKPASVPPRPFDGFTVEQLKEEAIKRGIELPGGLKKQEILDILLKHEAAGSTGE